MSQTNRRTARRSSRQRVNRRHGTLWVTTVAVLSLGAVVVVAALAFNVLSNRSDVSAVAWSATPYVGGPRLAVDRTLVDQGSVPYNHEVDATYHLKNVGDQPLTLQTPTVDIVEGC